MMACMTQDSGGPLPAGTTVTRLGEDDWRRWREVRLTALTDSPAAFGSAVEDERAIAEDGWREQVRNAAVFVATAGDEVAGAVAGLYRDSAEDRGLGAMWVAPQWRGHGVAGLLVAAIADWSRSGDAIRVGLWVPGQRDVTCTGEALTVLASWRSLAADRDPGRHHLRLGLHT